MHFSASVWPHRANPSLPSNGKVLVLERRNNWLGLGCQSFKNSPTIFGTSLAPDLKAFSANQHGCTLLQYVDDLLLVGPTHEDCMEGTRLFLSLLWKAGYKVSQKKAQIWQDTVKYLGFHLSQGQCELGPERKQAVCSIPDPKTHQQTREFLGAAGFCQIWIPNYSLLAKPLYEATKGEKWELMAWGEKQEKAFKEIKRVLTNDPALGLPDVMKSFFLYVHERLGTAVGVLSQLLGLWHHLMAYLSRQLDVVS
jgi:hypothetical protein